MQLTHGEGQTAVGCANQAMLARFAQLVAQECARVCEQHAADHEESARDESDERFAVYAKHERRCAAAIKARFGIKE